MIRRRHAVLSDPAPKRTLDPATGRPWPIYDHPERPGCEYARWDLWVLCGGAPRKIEDHHHLYADLDGDSQTAPHGPPLNWECDRCVAPDPLGPLPGPSGEGDWSAGIIIGCGVIGLLLLVGVAVALRLFGW